MSDIPTLIADHLSETVQDDAVLGQMLRWLRTMVKATSTMQAASLGVAEDFQELQARKLSPARSRLMTSLEKEQFKEEWERAHCISPEEAPATVPQEDFCTYCDTTGHHRGNCPEVTAVAIAAPLVVCPHTSTKPGRSGQNICTACGEDVTNLPKKSTFGFQ